MNIKKITSKADVEVIYEAEAEKSNDSLTTTKKVPRPGICPRKVVTSGIEVITQTSLPILKLTSHLVSLRHRRPSWRGNFLDLVIGCEIHESPEPISPKSRTFFELHCSDGRILAL